jgi:dynein heavy chain 1
VFPGSSIIQQREGELKNTLISTVVKYNLVASDAFIEKCMQLFQIQNLCHGVMMVGPTGVGKSAAWKLLLDCMERVDKI